jgi:aromatic ring-cleaving dioxygenase
MTKDTSAIAAYHAHVYFDSPATRAVAASLRDQVAAAFPDARLGGWHEIAVGPHTSPMFQILFATGRLATLLPWLMLNRAGLSILVHPETGNDYADHAEHAAWLGTPLPLRLDILKAMP